MPAKKIDGDSARSRTQRQARLELLAAVAHEARPALGARDELLERRQHLAAVADAEREACRAAAKNAANSSRARGVEQDRLRPALARAEHVAVGEAAARRRARGSRRGRRAPAAVAHVHVDGVEAGAVERGGHLDLAVHALLAQDGDARARRPATKRRREVRVRLEGQARRQPRVARVAAAPRAPRRRRRGRRAGAASRASSRTTPRAGRRAARRAARGPVAHDDPIARHGCADQVDGVAEAVAREGTRSRARRRWRAPGGPRRAPR